MSPSYPISLGFITSLPCCHPARPHPRVSLVPHQSFRVPPSHARLYPRPPTLVVRMLAYRHQNRRDTRRDHNRNNRGAAPRHALHTAHRTLQAWTRRAEALWSESTGPERSALGLAALAIVAVAGVAINILFHVSLAIAFLIIPLIFAPILLSIMASATLFFMLTFTTAGAGAFLLGTPLVAFAFLTKLMFPFAVVAAGAAYFARRLLGWDTSRELAYDYENEGEYAEDEEEQVLDAEAYVEDDFESFDRKLRNRDAFARRSTDVTSWGLSDVVDELDFTGLGEYRQLFIEERIDGRTLLGLSDQNIKLEFGGHMPLGDRMRLSQLVADLRRRSSRLP